MTSKRWVCSDASYLMRIRMGELRKLILESSFIDEPYRTEEEWAIFDACINEPNLIGQLPEETLNVHELIPTQDMDETGITSHSLGPITVFDNGSEKLVIDGHHRLKRAMFDGESQIQAFVFHAPEPLTINSAARLLGVSPQEILVNMSSADQRKFGNP